ncbi:MAG: VUT family protein [Bacilli bacterium]|nr:VUT family protein [Bacilli bacterium]
MKKENKLKNKKKTNLEYEDNWIYVLLLSAVVILGESLKNYTFELERFSLTYALFLLPIIYFLTNYITKKKGYKKSILAISISGIAMVLFVAIMNICVGRGFEFSNVVGDFCGYIISQLINLTIYQFLLDNTKPNFILIFLTYIFALVVYYLFYSLFYITTLNVDTYWVAYFTTLILQGMLIMPLVFIDLHIKRGK